MPLEKFLVETVSLALQNPIMAAALVIVYLQFTMRYGAAAEYFNTLDGLVAVVIALSTEVDGVDEEAVVKKFDQGDSNEFLDGEADMDLHQDYPTRERGEGD